MDISELIKGTMMRHTKYTSAARVSAVPMSAVLMSEWRSERASTPAT